MINFESPPLVEVLWVDAYSEPGWKGGLALEKWIKEDIEYEHLTKTVGYILYQTDDKIVVAQTIAQCEMVSELMGIPKNYIKEIRILECAERRTPDMRKIRSDKGTKKKARKTAQVS